MDRVRLSPCKPKAPQPKGQAEGARQGSLRQAIMYAYDNERGKIRVKVTDGDSI